MNNNYETPSSGGCNFSIMGGFFPDEVEATCVGLRSAIDASQTLSRDDFLVAAKRVMDAVWTQPLPSRAKAIPDVSTIDALVAAIESGWAFNANEGDNIWSVFGDIRLIESNGRAVGFGTLAPGGAIVHDGRELVLWRDRRWAVMRGPGSLKDNCTNNPLRIIRSK